MRFRQISSLVLIFLLLNKLLFSLFWQLKYELNKAEITQKYCENKNRPALHCNGQCYLAKQLRKADLELQSKEQNQQQHLDLGEKLVSQEPFLVNDFCSFETKPISIQEKKYCAQTHQNYSFLFITKIFHPPCI
jgi:hypothetical protein